MDSKVKEFIKKMPRWKLILWIGLVCASSGLIIYTLLFAFSIQGIEGMYRWILYFKLITIVLIIIAIGLPILAVIDLLTAGRNKKALRIPARVIWILAIIGFGTPLGLNIWVRSNWATRAGDSVPQLLMFDGTGVNGNVSYAVTFYTKEASQNTLKWGPGSLVNTLPEVGTYNEHVFVLPNLIAGTEYWYQLNDESKIYKFKTPNNTPETLKFAVISDPHLFGTTSDLDATKQILGQIGNSSRGNDAMFICGDMIDFGFDDRDWIRTIDVISNVSSIMPTRALMGNHDSLVGGVNFYKNYYAPENIPVVNGTQLYQRIDINNIHFLCLNLEWGTETYYGAQEAWLKAQLQMIPKNDWTIVMSHTYYFASGTYAGGTPWQDNSETIPVLTPLFEEYGVDLVFSGHIHAMEYLKKNTTSYSIIGSAGGKLEPEKTYTSQYSQFYNREDFGYEEISISGNTANLSYYDLNANQLFTVNHIRATSA